MGNRKRWPAWLSGDSSHFCIACYVLAIVTKQQVLWAVLIVTCLIQVGLVWHAWRRRNKFAPNSAPHRGQLAYPDGWLVVGKAFLISAALGFAILVNLPLPELWLLGIWAAISVLLGALGVFLIVAHGVERHEFSDDGITLRRLRGDTRYLSWSDIRSIRHWLNLETFRLVNRVGDVGWVSTHLDGIASF